MLTISELEEANRKTLSNFQNDLISLEQEAEQKDAEIESLTQTIERLGEQMYILEDDNDRLKEESDRQHEDDAAECERLEAVNAAQREVRVPRQLAVVQNLNHSSRKSPLSNLSRKK